MTANLIAKSSVTIGAPASKVWQALIDPKLIKQYLYGSEILSDWQEGSPVIYKGEWKGKPFEDKGTVVKFEPEKLLILTHWSPLSGTPDLPENYHTVRYELTSAEGETRLTINQDKNSSVEEQQQSQQFWTAILETMKKMLE